MCMNTGQWGRGPGPGEFGYFIESRPRGRFRDAYRKHCGGRLEDLPRVCSRHPSRDSTPIVAARCREARGRKTEIRTRHRSRERIVPAREPALTVIRDVHIKHKTRPTKVTGFRRKSAGSWTWFLAILRVRANDVWSDSAGVPPSSPVRLPLSGVGG